MWWLKKETQFYCIQLHRLHCSCEIPVCFTCTVLYEHAHFQTNQFERGHVNVLPACGNVFSAECPLSCENLCSFSQDGSRFKWGKIFLLFFLFWYPGPFIKIFWDGHMKLTLSLPHHVTLWLQTEPWNIYCITVAENVLNCQVLTEFWLKNWTSLHSHTVYLPLAYVNVQGCWSRALHGLVLELYSVTCSATVS